MRKTKGKGMGSAFGARPGCDGTAWVYDAEHDGQAAACPQRPVIGQQLGSSGTSCLQNGADPLNVPTFLRVLRF